MHRPSRPVIEFLRLNIDWINASTRSRNQAYEATDNSGSSSAASSTSARLGLVWFFAISM